MANVVLTPGGGARLFLGVRRRIKSAVPGVGAEWSFTIPGGAYLRLLLARTSIVASGVAGTRLPGFEIVDVDATLYSIVPTQGFAAGVTGVVSYACDNVPLAGGASGSVVTVPVPNVLFSPGMTLRSRTSAIDVGDQYAATEFLFEEIIIGADGLPQGPSYLDNVSPTMEIS